MAQRRLESGPKKGGKWPEEGWKVGQRRSYVMLYLLEHGADYNHKFKMHNFDPPDYTFFYVDILYILRLCIYPLDSKEYKDKLKVIDFLRRRGMDYRKSPIPSRAIGVVKRKISPKNEEELQEYLKRY